MTRIEEGTKKLGLLINQEETMRSGDYLNYGKCVIFRENLRNNEVKRWSWVLCTSNDQMPTTSNIMSTVGSNALTVSSQSTSPVNSIVHYNFLACLAYNVIEDHNPALGREA